MYDIIKFMEHSVNHYIYTQQGDWKKCNVEIKKINTIYKKVKEEGDEAMEKLLQLIYSNKPEVSAMAATYCMKFNPEKCLQVMKRLSHDNIPHISFAAKQAIQNWENNEWFIP